MTKNGLRELSIVKRIEKLIPESFLNAFPSLVQIGVLLVSFFLFNLWYLSLTELNPDDFSQIVLTSSPTQYFKGSIWLLIPFAAIVALMISRRNLITLEWNSIEGGSKLRLIICTCLAVLTWAHISYPFNYFLFENALIERLAVLVLMLLVFWRPFFLILYVFFPVLIHFGEPLLVNHWSITELPIRVLLLFCTQLIVWLIFPKYKWKIGAFVFMLLCIVAGNYFPAGFAKIASGWLKNNHIYFLLSNMYTDGWVSFLSQETLSDITHFLSKYNLLLKLGCLVMEFGCILIFVRKNWSVRFFLLGFLSFHTLVFIMTGILFWPWMLLEIVLLVVFWKKGVFQSIIKSFSIWHIVFSVCLIFISSKWLRPSIYVWHDSPLSYSYSFEVIDTSGKTSNLPSNTFWPKYYEFAWTNDFHFIHEKPTLNIVWGVSFNGREVEELLAFKDAEQVLAYEKEFGTNQLNPELAKEFERYMKDFVKEKKYELPLNPWFKTFSAPAQRLVYPVDNIYDGKNDIVKIIIYQKLAFFNGEEYKELRKTKVSTIDIK